MPPSAPALSTKKGTDVAESTSMLRNGRTGASESRPKPWIHKPDEVADLLQEGSFRATEFEEFYATSKKGDKLVEGETAPTERCSGIPQVPPAQRRRYRQTPTMQ